MLALLFEIFDCEPPNPQCFEGSSEAWRGADIAYCASSGFDLEWSQTKKILQTKEILPMNKCLRSITYLSIVFLICVVPSFAQVDPFDFAMSEPFLKRLADGGTIQPIFHVHLDARTRSVHTLSDDCEIHVATTPQGEELGSPPSVIVEPPNLCKFVPVGTTKKPSEKKLRDQAWPNLLDEKVMKKDCDVRGFPRIFTEHASGASDPANPNHVFEVHPALSITCGSDEVSFASFLTVFPGMRAIKPSTTDSCIKNRELKVRFRDGQYEFREEGGRCGNFAIVEVGNVEPDWVREIGGGHSAIARVSPDGQSLTTLKIYTLSGSDADKWLADLRQGNQDFTRKFLHGMFTYDYFSIVKTVRRTDGTWLKPDKWTKVEFPLAFVVFGESETAPWEEE
jgi:hypothetical protein